MKARNLKRFDYADTLELQIRASRLPQPVRDLKAVPGRQFRIDLAWPELRLCVECDGESGCTKDGTFVPYGRHGSRKGMATDAEKQNGLVLAGWRPLRFTGAQVKSGYALACVADALRIFSLDNVNKQA